MMQLIIFRHLSLFIHLNLVIQPFQSLLHILHLLNQTFLLFYQNRLTGVNSAYISSAPPIGRMPGHNP